MAARYWVGGAGTWDGSNTANWSATSGGAGGASVPTSADQVFFNGSSGTGTVTLAISPTIQQLSFAGFTQTFNFQTNSITISSTGSPAFTGSTSMTVTGTPVINVITSSTKSVTAGAVTEANSISFNVSGSSTFSVSGSVRDLNFTGFSGTLSSGARTIFGNLTLSATMTTAASANNITTFAATSGTQTINTNGVAFNDNMTFSGVGGTRQLLSAVTARRIQHTAGTFDLNTYTFTVFTYSVSGAAASSTTFTGGGRIVVTSNSETVLANTSSNYAATGDLDIYCSYAGATGSRTIGWIANETKSVDFTASTVPGVTFNTAATDTIIFSGGFKNVDTTGRTSAIQLFNLTVYGNLVIPTGATLSASGGTVTFAATSGVKTITTNGVSLTATGFAFSGAGGSWQLQGATTTGSTSLTSGTLDINGFTYTTATFSSNGASARSIAFGSGNITVTGTGTVWDMSTGSNFTRTGTPTVNVSNNSATATTVNTAFLNETNALDFNYTTGTYALTDSTSVYGNVNFSGFSGTVNGGSITVFGNFNAGSSATFSSSSTINMAATSGTKTITTNGVTIDRPIAFNGAGGTWQLQDALTSGSSRRSFLQAGTLDLNGFTATFGQLFSSYSNARSIAFNGGAISIVGTGTVFDFATITNFSRTGTPTVNISNNSAAATTVTTGTPTEAQALDFNYTVGTYALTDTSARYRSLNLTGFAGTFQNTARTYFGSLNVGSTATMTAGSNAQTFSATSGVWGITTNGRTLDFPMTFNGVGGTWQLQDALTMGSTRTTTLASGTLDLNGFTYTTGLFASSNSNVRSIAFGAGQISLSGNNATIWNNTTATNFSYTGTFKVVATYTGATGTRTLSQGGTEATAQSISTTGSSGFILGTSSTDIKTLTGSWGSVDITGMLGTFGGGARTVYGDFNVGSTATLASSGSVTTFAATSGTKTITSNGRTIPFPLTFNGIGGAWTLQDALTLGGVNLTLVAGTFDANNYNVSAVGSGFSSSGSGVRTLALGSGTWTIGGTGVNAFNCTTSTNLTVTGTATISMTGATAKTFAGGGLTWPTINQGGAGALTVSGNNTFNNITSGYTATGACTISFTGGSTQSVNNFTASGTPTGQLTINSTNTTPHNLVKLGGGDVNVYYCTISYSNASP